jgi:hypothetical protein
MQLNLIGKIFLGALAARVVQRTYNNLQLQPLTETACSGNWVGFNQLIDRLSGSMTYEERCNAWTFIRMSPSDWSSKVQPLFG